MAKDIVSHLRFVGTTPQSGHREYGFRVEDKEKGLRQVILTIENGMFRESQLMFQEAPDLCYQKLLADLRNETEEMPIQARVSVTVSDVDAYRGSHPNIKLRAKRSMKSL